MPKVQGKCKVCGVQIEFWPSQAREYCSRKCMGLAHKGREMPNKPRTGRSVECERCGLAVWVRKGHTAQHHFCSVVCQQAWQRRNQVAQECLTCGKHYTLSASQKYYRGDHCSRACAGRSRMKRPLDREHNGKPAAVDRQGYVRIFVPGHLRATKSGWIFEHRWIVEQALGRYLDQDEHVHHLNHVRSDNRPENLQLLSAQEHAGITGRENGEALRAAIESRQQLARYIEKFGPLE